LVDIVDPTTRSRMMSGIHAKNTSPELIVRKALHARGFRFRVHSAGLPGKPDIVLPKYKAVVLIHGCFWHGHNCRYFKIPQTRTEFWLDKIGKNRARDALQIQNLNSAGWRSLTIWECAIRKMKSTKSDDLIELISEWINSNSPNREIDESYTLRQK